MGKTVFSQTKSIVSQDTV